jgi:lipoprotein-anchoring transpeptidase ErfK/SrfK
LRYAAALAIVAVLGAAGAGSAAPSRHTGILGNPPPATSPAASPATSPTVAAAAVASPELPRFTYGAAPAGFPPDPTPLSATALTEGLRPSVDAPVYDAPGGRPLAFLAPTISGVPVTVPITDRRPGWVSVLLPSVNRTVGWVPISDAWTPVALADQVVVRRQAHELAWYRDGAHRGAWTVTIGSAATPTPLGRTFVLGRSTLPGAVYAGVDALALGSVPDDPSAVATGLRGAHIGIHGWYRNDFGRNVSNGCVRVPKDVQATLVSQLVPGTPVLVVD